MDGSNNDGASPKGGRDISRREFLRVASLGLAGGLTGHMLWQRNEAMLRSATFIAKAPEYDDGIAEIVRRGLAELGVGRSAVAGKSVLLKPNLVEPSLDAPHINTHPRFIRAVAETFRELGAREVFVAEAAGHCRDTHLVLEQSGLENVLHEAGIPFVDMNYDDVFRADNGLNFSRLGEMMLPASLRRADLIVSLPKMKTHHWAGATLSMKNFFGVMPGICYGWPKNVLHWAGVTPSILDINATVKPHLGIVDGIVGMEGDGPIMGTPKSMGLIVMGTNLPALDATCARLMDLDPSRIDYLRLASGRLGPIAQRHIEQRGETVAGLVQPFDLLDIPAHRGLRA